MKKIFLFTSTILLSVIANSQPDINLVAFGPTFNQPTVIKHANDNRLFIVEKAGIIKILNADGSVNATPFLNIQSSISTGSERGLLGLAFHPNYSNNGYFYVNYTNNSGNTVVARFTRNSMDNNLADAASQNILMTVTQPYSNHNGGDLTFGPDGYLYIALGDGGSGGDPGDRAQNLNTLLGKILRIDVDSGTPYAIPPDNPYLNDGDANTLPEIWAYGLRNPWRISMDFANQDIWIADVGQGNWEEINKVPVSVGGINYGWRCYEANYTYNTSGCPPSNTMVFPIGEYDHSNGRCSITGGYKYNGSLYPNFQGLYFFADYCSNEIGYLELDNGVWNMTLSTPFSGNFWSTFGEDYNGELYIAGIGSGQIYKITDTNLSVDDFNKNIFRIYPNPAQDHITLETSNIKTITFHIFDIYGKLVDTFVNEQTSKQYSLDKLTSGVYFIKANLDANTYTKKLVVH